MPAPFVVWRTLRHLSFRQIRHQVRNRLLPAGSPRPLPILWSTPRPLVDREKNASRTLFDGKDRFRFNNEERRFAGDWNDPAARKLWLYNLHYMAWIFDLPREAEPGAGAREDWMRRWIRENPRESGGNGWEPYPISLRLFNWCKHFSLVGTEPSAEVLESIGDQASRLLDRLEFHLDGNHLLENLFALAFVGFHLDGKAPAGRRARLRIARLLENALAEQFLADGGHYELSPMYHAILLERMLDLIDCWPSLSDPFPGLKPRLEACARAALYWLDAMSVAGRFSLFNDSAYDPAPEAAMLLEYGTALLGYAPLARNPLRALEASGYFRAEAGPLTLLFDGGKLGPDHQMGHAQGDMLSICLWVSGAPILVHPGNFEYVPGPMRDYCRSTASHNTLSVDRCEQAEWWASHRVGRRGRPREVRAALDSPRGIVVLSGAHDGFARLPGNPLHRRSLELGPASLEVSDTLEPASGLPCKVFFHFHPDCVATLGKGRIEISSPAGLLVLECDRPLHLEEGWHCPEFGLRIRNQVAVAEFDGGACHSRIILGTGNERP